VNLINGKSYLGSTSNGLTRLRFYFDLNSLKKANMPIYLALLKYGHENFILDIIEYCSPTEAGNREQFYLDNHDFEYNILEKANSSLGYKHTEKSIAKMKGRKNLLGFKHSPETLAKLRKISLIRNIQKNLFLK
jgi:group I intron endonuclease